MMNTNISVIIPVYNEEKRIRKSLLKIIEYLKSRGFDYEIIIVDDGSTDKTIEVVKVISDERVRVLNNGQNKGKGFSVRHGMMNAKNDWILFSDADLSTPIEELDNFIQYLQYPYDVLIGSRSLKGSHVIVHQPFYREYSGKIFNKLVQLLVIQGISDTQCGFKLFKKEIAHKVFSKQIINGFGFDIEVLFIAKKYGYKIKEIPVIWKNDKVTKVNLFKDSFKMFINIFSIRINDWRNIY